MDISNKTLALLLVAAVIISLVGTFSSLKKLDEVVVITPPTVTGRALSGSGYVNITISPNSSCTVDSNVDFGSGNPQASYTLDTDSDNSQHEFSCDGSVAGTGDCWGIMVNNTGNVELNINITSDKNGTDFLGTGHTTADFDYWIDDTEIENNACTTEGAAGEVSVNDKIVCTGLNFTDSRDVIVVDFNVTIDQNTVPGAKNATMTITCTAS